MRKGGKKVANVKMEPIQKSVVMESPKVLEVQNNK